MDDDLALLLFAVGVALLFAGGALFGGAFASGGSALPASLSNDLFGGSAMNGSSDADTLARTLYGEARGESDAGKQGVASVIMNRARNGSYPGGGSVSGVCIAPYQFSCWNANDPNRAVILAADASNPVFADCLAIAQDALAGALPDNTGGATYYYDTSIAQPSFWAGQGIAPTVQIGRLVFGAVAGIA